MTSLKTHKLTFEAAKRKQGIDPEVFRRIRDKYADVLKLHDRHATAATMRTTLLPRVLPTTGGGDTPPTSLGPAGQDQESSSSDATSHTEEEDPDQTIPMEVYPPQTEGGTYRSWSDQVDDEEASG